MPSKLVIIFSQTRQIVVHAIPAKLSSNHVRLIAEGDTLAFISKGVTYSNLRRFAHSRRRTVTYDEAHEVNPALLALLHRLNVITKDELEVAAARRAIEKQKADDAHAARDLVDACKRLKVRVPAKIAKAFPHMVPLSQTKAE